MENRPTANWDANDRYGSGVSYELSSNPYAASSSNNIESTMGWTLTTRDSVGRVTSVAHYSGGVPPGSLSDPPNGTGTKWCSGTCAPGTGTVTTVYSGATTTVTDEAANPQIHTTDGLGRLLSVQEANGTTTNYSYDGLDNLTGATMGSQSRNFTYSSLSRLLSATQKPALSLTDTMPAETWIQKTDANGTILCVGDGPSGGTCPGTVSSQPAYDGINRPRSKTYSVAAPTASTPTVQYSYDQDTKGTLYSVASGNNSTAYTHDKLGRVTGSTQTTAGNPFPAFSYAYSLSDQRTDITYPSGGTSSMPHSMLRIA